MGGNAGNLHQLLTGHEHLLWTLDFFLVSNTSPRRLLSRERAGQKLWLRNGHPIPLCQILEEGRGGKDLGVLLEGKEVPSYRGRGNGKEMVMRTKGTRTDKLCARLDVKG